MSTSITFSETVPIDPSIGLQDLPAEILEKISDELDWVSRARCRMLCKAFDQNMNNSSKDMEDALTFYYQVLHGPAFKHKRKKLGYPEEWCEHFKKRSVYTVMLHKKRNRNGRAYYPSIVTTVFYHRNKKLSKSEIQYQFNKHFLDMTKEEMNCREIVTGNTDDIVDRFYLEEHSSNERELCITFYKHYTDHLLTLEVLQELRRLLYHKTSDAAV